MDVETQISCIARDIAELNGYDYENLKPTQKQNIYIKAIISYLQIKESEALEVENIDVDSESDYARMIS